MSTIQEPHPHACAADSETDSMPTRQQGTANAGGTPGRRRWRRSAQGKGSHRRAVPGCRRALQGERAPRRRCRRDESQRGQRG